jgi:hypothetical protein
MCWNQYVSINTFLFGVFVLLLISFYNKYSNYKIDEFKNPYTYFFIMSFITMQFIEFVLWRNLDNNFINKLMSILGSLLLVIQPIASLTMLHNIELRNKLLIIYSIPSFSYFIYKLLNKKFYTTISKNGHLKWNWASDINHNFLFYLFYLFFLYFSLFINKNYMGILLTLPLFGLFYYLYYNDGSAGSLWCWSINIIMLYYLIKLLILLPYNMRYNMRYNMPHKK